jgi:hypothetical protein
MYRYVNRIILIIAVVICLGGLISCDDDDETKSTILMEADPSLGYLYNSSSYTLKIDLDEKEDFAINLVPQQLYKLNLQADQTHIFHVLVLNSKGRVVSEYVNTFYVNDVPLDNQLSDFMCNWFYEFTDVNPEYGFANRSGA